MKFTFDRYGAKSLMESNVSIDKKTPVLSCSTQFCISPRSFGLLHFLTNQNERYIVNLVDIVSRHVTLL